MIQSFITIALRILWRNKITSFVNIFSLSVGSRRSSLSCCMFITKRAMINSTKIMIISTGWKEITMQNYLLSLPIAWYLLQFWLSKFAYHIKLETDIFIIAALFAISVALLTVTWQSWRAASANPVKSLRYE